MSLKVDIIHNFGTAALDVRFSAPAGVTALFGRSGAGKTSVVNAVAGLLRPDEGHIRLNGRVLQDAGSFVPAHKRRLGYVFQDARLFAHMSVAQNLDYGTRFARSRPASDHISRDDVIGLLGLAPLLTRRPHSLSGGEKQRVAIGRALLSRPDMLLMDEPLAALDAARKSDILPYLERLKSAAHMPILYVSHALDEVARLADTLVLLHNGACVTAGPVFDVLADPAHMPLLGVREAGSVLRGTVLSHATDGLSAIAVPGGTLLLPGIEATIGAEVRLRIRASDVILAKTRPEGLSSLNILPVTVKSVHIGTGPGAAIALDANGTGLLARITARSAREMQLAPGMDCFALLKATSVAQSAIGQAQAAGPSV